MNLPPCDHDECGPTKCKRGFTHAPSLDELKPTKREQQLLKELWDWQENSRNTELVLGKPLGRKRLARRRGNESPTL